MSPAVTCPSTRSAPPIGWERSLRELFCLVNRHPETSVHRTRRLSSRTGLPAAFCVQHVWAVQTSAVLETATLSFAMRKVGDPFSKLRCVHCLSTETPLWRAGPDGPKTLCNACGVRYKKGKLVLYKDSNGNITAVQRIDTAPVHIPPLPRKASKKNICSSSPPPLPVSSGPIVDDAHRRSVRKVPGEGSVAAAAVAKKPRSRSRRANAGQLPGRYSFTAVQDCMSKWQSHSIAPQGTTPESSSEMLRPADGGLSTTVLRFPGILCGPVLVSALTAVQSIC